MNLIELLKPYQDLYNLSIYRVRQEIENQRELIVTNNLSYLPMNRDHRTPEDQSRQEASLWNQLATDALVYGESITHTNLTQGSITRVDPITFTWPLREDQVNGSTPPIQVMGEAGYTRFRTSSDPLGLYTNNMSIQRDTYTTQTAYSRPYFNTNLTNQQLLDLESDDEFTTEWNKHRYNREDNITMNILKLRAQRLNLTIVEND